LIARAGARAGGAIRIDERDVATCGEEMMRGPGAEDAGTDHNDLRHNVRIR
jgi:hypothetical protein